MKTKRLLLTLFLGMALTLAMLGALTTSLWAANTYSLTRVTTAAGSGNRGSYYPSINSDGSKIAFRSDTDFLGQGIPDNQLEIWLYDTATMTVTRVTTAAGSGSRNSWDPSINSDGSKIAFHSDADFLGQGIPPGQDEIWLYDTATLTVTRVTTAMGSGSRDSRNASINSDGSKIAFDSDADFLGQGIPAGQYEVWLYDTATMTVTRVTTGGSGRYSGGPSINSDGSKIAFVSDADFLSQGIPDNQLEIWLYDTATLTVTRVTTAGSGSRDSWYPSINSDGSKIAFNSDTDFLGQGIPDGQYEIWLYDTATMTVTRVTTAAGSGSRLNYNPSINSDGSKIAFRSDADFLGQGIPRSQYEIWLYDTATMTVTRVTSTPPPVSGNRYSQSPSINSDGSKIAFFSDADLLGQGISQYQYEIWLAGPVAPEIDVQGNGQSIANGATTPSITNDTDFGSTAVSSGVVAHTFTISNSGTADLTLTGSPAVTLTTSMHFSVTVQPSSPVISNSTTTFNVTFDPSATGDFTDTVNIANNDPDENPYTFVISGTGAIEADLAINQSLLHDFPYTVFTIVAQNDGPDAAPGAVISVTFPVEISNITWTCAESGGASCTASGSGNTIYDTLGNFPNGGVVTYTVTTQAPSSPTYTNAAEVMPSARVTDPDMSNNYSEQVTGYLIHLPLILKDAS